jgi:hypothetical protein
VVKVGISEKCLNISQRLARCKPEDEKRSVVILPDEAWGDWLRCKSVLEAHDFLSGPRSMPLSTHADPR